jgi:hypothetical protein
MTNSESIFTSNQIDSSKFINFTLEKDLDIIVQPIFPINSKSNNNLNSQSFNKRLFNLFIESEQKIAKQNIIDSDIKPYIHDYKKPFYDID